MDFFKSRPAGQPDFLIAGLGNPEKRFENTRHNAGFMTLDLLAEKLGVKINRVRFKGYTAESKTEESRLLLLKPATYMNSSGESVREAMAFYHIPPERTLIILDDVYLPIGRLRIRRKGSDGGHNGMKSIIYLNGSDNFPRIKIGVGQKPNPNYDLVDWVLSRFTEEELGQLSPALQNAASAALLIAGGEINRAMELYTS